VAYKECVTNVNYALHAKYALHAYNKLCSFYMHRAIKKPTSQAHNVKQSWMT